MKRAKGMKKSTSFIRTKTWWICISVIGIFTFLQNNSVIMSDFDLNDLIVLTSFQPLLSSFSESVEEGVARARSAIQKAAMTGNTSGNSSDEVAVYRNPGAFHQSYREMEKRFKVYVYEEGYPPIFHDGPKSAKYASEGKFIHEIELEDPQRFRTKNPHKAYAYFMPFSVVYMVKYLFEPEPHYKAFLQDFISDYVDVISTEYPFWNKTEGADHFMVACHDWGPYVSKGNDLLYNTSIRVLCNANTSEGFNPQKDATLPQINLPRSRMPREFRSLLRPSKKTNAPRPYLAFFAGGVHGPIRPVLLRYWKGRDLPEMQVYEYLPEDQNYQKLMLKSKFCLCPSGFEVASPRITEAIYAECVPVIISKNYVLPFSDVLRWEAFSITVEVSEIPRLKDILEGVSEEKYKRLKEGVRVVKKHFVFNKKPKRFDVFHMILHSIWLRRINIELL